MIFNSFCCIWKSNEVIYNCYIIFFDLFKNICIGKKIVMIVVGFILIRLECLILVIMVLWVFKDLNVIIYVFLISLYIKKEELFFVIKWERRLYGEF